MANDAHTFDSQQRGSTVFRVIDALAEVPIGCLRKNIPELPSHRGGQRLLEHVFDHFHQPLADLQGYVADKSVAHNYVGDAAVNVATFDVADKVDRQELEQRSCAPGQIISLVLLLPDRE